MAGKLFMRARLFLELSVAMIVCDLRCFRQLFLWFGVIYMQCYTTIFC